MFGFLLGPIVKPSVASKCDVWPPGTVITIDNNVHPAEVLNVSGDLCFISPASIIPAGQQSPNDNTTEITSDIEMIQVPDGKAGNGIQRLTYSSNCNLIYHTMCREPMKAILSNSEGIYLPRSGTFNKALSSLKTDIEM